MIPEVRVQFSLVSPQDQKFLGLSSSPWPESMKNRGGPESSALIGLPAVCTVGVYCLFLNSITRPAAQLAGIGSPLRIFLLTWPFVIHIEPY